MRTIKTQKSNLTDQVAVGDHLKVYEKSGRIVDMTLRAFDHESLKGTLRDNSSTPVVVKINDIKKIKVEKHDKVKSMAAFLGVITVAVPILAIGMVYRTLIFQPL